MIIKQYFPFICLWLLLINPARSMEIANQCPFYNPSFDEINMAFINLENLLNEDDECNIEAANDENNFDFSQFSADIQNANQDNLGAIQNQTNSLTQQALLGAGSINSVFSKDKCKEKLLTVGDHAKSLLDTAVGLSPFLLVYGGENATGWVLGANVLQSIVNAVIDFFWEQRKKMDTLEVEDTFIRNSCLFYNLNNYIREVFNLITNGTGQLETEKILQEELLRRHLLTKPELDSGAMRLKNQRASISEARKTTTQYLAKLNLMRDEPRGCRIGRQLIRDANIGEDAVLEDRPSLVRSVIDTAYASLTSDADSKIRLLEIKDFTDHTNRYDDNFEDENPESCFAPIDHWFNALHSIVDGTDKAFANILEKNDSYKRYASWEDEHSKKKTKIKKVSDKIEFIDNLAVSNGVDLHLSKALASLRRSEERLFDGKSSYGFSYVEHKIDESVKNQEVFEDKVKRFKDHHKDYHSNENRCKEVKETIFTYNEALNHVIAADEYCQAFEQSVGNWERYRTIFKICKQHDNDEVKGRLEHFAKDGRAFKQLVAMQNFHNYYACSGF